VLVSWIRAGGRFKRHYCEPFKVAAFKTPWFDLEVTRVGSLLYSL
jgi:hypothetical protein